jgi:predicted ferric reductase
MRAQLWWDVARATGVVGWALLAAAVIWGLLLSTRVVRGRPTPAWLLDMHRFLGGAAVIFTSLHITGLVADTYVHFGAADLLVPFASSWHPGAVALGVVSLYLLVAIELTSLLMRRLPRPLWRKIHLTSFGLFWAATYHFILAGTDAGNALARWGISLTAATVVFLTLVRILVPRRARRSGARISASGSPPSRTRGERTPVAVGTTRTGPGTRRGRRDVTTTPARVPHERMRR